MCAGTTQLHPYKAEDVNRTLLLTTSLSPGPNLTHSPEDSGISFSFTRHWPSTQAPLPVPADSLVQRAGRDEGRAQSHVQVPSFAGGPPGVGINPPHLDPNPLPSRCNFLQHMWVLWLLLQGMEKQKRDPKTSIHPSRVGPSRYKSSSTNAVV